MLGGKGMLIIGPEEDDEESPSSSRGGGEPPAGFEAEIRDAFPGLVFDESQIRALHRAIRLCCGDDYEE